MNLLIVGSRSIKEFDLAPHIPCDTSLIISGGARGIDTIAEEYADNYSIPKKIIKPQYNIYGRGAPIKRNEEMVDIADKILVIWDGISKGTDYTVKYAKKKNKDIKIIMVKN